MRDDPDPIPPGSRGTITNLSTVDVGDGPYLQVSVTWDSGRTLALCSPPDQFRYIDEPPCSPPTIFRGGRR